MRIGIGSATQTHPEILRRARFRCRYAAATTTRTTPRATGHVGVLVDEARDALDATTASETADGRLGDALDVVAEHLAMTLGAALSESFTSLSTS